MTSLEATQEQSFSVCGGSGAAARLCPPASAAGRLSWLLTLEISGVACLTDAGIWVPSFLLLPLLLAPAQWL